MMKEPVNTFEDWLENQLDAAHLKAVETMRVASNSYGAGYERGFADALQSIFAILPRDAAKSPAPEI